MGVVKPKAGSGGIGRLNAERTGKAGDWQSGGTRGCAGVVTHPVSAEGVSEQQGAARQGFTTAAQGTQLKDPHIPAPVTLLLLPWWHPQAGGSQLLSLGGV